MSRELLLWIKKLIVTGLLIALCYGMYLTQSIIMLLFVAGFVSMLIIPLVDKLKKHKIPEWLTIVLVYIGILLLATIVILTIIPIVVNYITNVVNQVITWSTTAQITFQTEGIRGFHLPKWIEDLIFHLFNEENISNTFDILKQNAGSIQKFLTNQVSTIADGGLSLLSSIGSMITNWMFIGIATFFIILERASIARVFLDITPGNWE